MSTFQDDQQQMKIDNHRINQAEIFLQWLQKNPQFGYTAAINQIKSYYAGDDWSFDDLSDSANRLVEKGVIAPLRPDRMESSAAKAKKEAEEVEAQERIELTDFICKARVMQPETEKSERARFLSQKATDISTLRQIKQNILAKKELQAKSVEELKQMIKPERVSQWKPVPAIYRNSRSMLIDLANRSPEEFRSLLRRCGEDQLNLILRKIDKE